MTTYYLIVVDGHGGAQTCITTVCNTRRILAASAEKNVVIKEASKLYNKLGVPLKSQAVFDVAPGIVTDPCEVCQNPSTKSLNTAVKPRAEGSKKKSGR